MKIAIIGTRGVPANYGGFETCAEEISVGLTQKNHNVSVYCRCGNIKGNPSTYKGVNLIYLPYVDSKYLGTLTHALLSFLHSIFKRYDIILAFNVGIAPLCIIPKLFRKRIVLNVDGFEWKRRKWGWLGKKYFQFCEYIAPFVVNCLVTDSKAIQRYYEEKYHISSIFIPYGSYVEKLIDANILKEYGVREDDYFFIASRLEPENNADLIVQAFKRVKTSKKLLIAGGANYQSQFIQKLTKKTKKTKDKRVRFLGPIYTPGHIKTLHCGCFAYIHGNEVGGTNPALLKAMGYGNCILALNVPYNLEVVDKSAIIFDKSVEDLRQKIQYVIQHPNIRRKYQESSIERIKKYYSWDKVIKSYEEVFKESLST